MSDDDIPASLAEAMAEIRRLRARVQEPAGAMTGEARLNTYVPTEYVAVEKTSLNETLAEIERLRARVAELEGRAAITFGTLEQPTDDEPLTFVHNVPPSAPPHNE